MEEAVAIVNTDTASGSFLLSFSDDYNNELIYARRLWVQRRSITLLPYPEGRGMQSNWLIRLSHGNSDPDRKGPVVPVETLSCWRFVVIARGGRKRLAFGRVSPAVRVQSKRHSDLEVVSEASKNLLRVRLGDREPGCDCPKVMPDGECQKSIAIPDPRSDEVEIEAVADVPGVVKVWFDMGQWAVEPAILICDPDMTVVDEIPPADRY